MITICMKIIKIKILMPCLKMDYTSQNTTAKINQTNQMDVNLAKCSIFKSSKKGKIVIIVTLEILQCSKIYFTKINFLVVVPLWMLQIKRAILRAQCLIHKKWKKMETMFNMKWIKVSKSIIKNHKKFMNIYKLPMINKSVHTIIHILKIRLTKDLLKIQMSLKMKDLKWLFKMAIHSIKTQTMLIQ